MVLGYCCNLLEWCVCVYACGLNGVTGCGVVDGDQTLEGKLRAVNPFVRGVMTNLVHALDEYVGEAAGTLPPPTFPPSLGHCSSLYATPACSVTVHLHVCVAPVPPWVSQRVSIGC